MHCIQEMEPSEYTSLIFPEMFVLSFPALGMQFFVRRITENDGISIVKIGTDTVWEKQCTHWIEELLTLREDTLTYRCDVFQCLVSFWRVFLDNLDIPDPKERTVLQVRMRQFLTYIEENYSHPIQLEDITRSGHVSKSACMRAFKESGLQSPMEYVLDLRLEKACLLLEKGELSAGEIAVKTGFQSQSYFGRGFREKMQCTSHAVQKKQEN